MSRPKILLCLPGNFSIRSFLMTDFIDIVLEKADVEVITTYDYFQDLRIRFKKTGLYLNNCFIPTSFEGKFAVWNDRLRRASYQNWDLFSHEHGRKLRNFRNNPPSPIDDENRCLSLIQRLFNPIYSSKIGIELIRYAENNAFRNEYSQSLIPKYKELIAKVNPTILLSTAPFRIESTLMLKVSRLMKLPSIYYVLSFDNITSRPPIPIFFDRYLVWNQMNRNELINQYPTIKRKQVEICGPLSFDWYKNDGKYLYTRKNWLRNNKLQDDIPVVLFGTCVHKYGPMEPWILRELLKANNKGKFGQEIQFLVRLHPNDNMKRWEDIKTDYPHLSFVHAMSGLSQQGKSIPLEKDLKSLVSDMTHCAMLVTTGSSIALDACRLDKPAIFIGFDERPGKTFDKLAKEIYKRNHLQRIVEIGGAKVANSQIELENLIIKYLSDPTRDGDLRKKTVLHYDPFLDGNASKRTAKAVLNFVYTNI